MKRRGKRHMKKHTSRETLKSFKKRLWKTRAKQQTQACIVLSRCTCLFGQAAYCSSGREAREHYALREERLRLEAARFWVGRQDIFVSSVVKVAFVG